MYERARKSGLKTVNKRADTKITKLTASDKKAWEAKLKVVVEKWVSDFEKKGLPYRQMLNDYLAKGS